MNKLLLGEKLAKKFPNTKPGEDWVLVKRSDNDYELVVWNVPGVVKPTLEEIDAYYSDAAVIKDSKMLRITWARNEALKNLTAIWDGDTWDANEETSNRIANALSMVREAGSLGIPTPSAIPWRTYDNKDRILTIAELTQMGAAVFLAQQMVWAKQAQLKNAIEAATTEAEVNAIEW